MLFGKTVAVHCENHTEHTDTVRTSHETHYVSATEPSRLMLFGETVAVHCENHTEHTDTLCGQNTWCYYVKASAMYSKHGALKGYIYTVVRDEADNTQIRNYKTAPGFRNRPFPACSAV
jgi:hypothetical protein